MPFTLKRFNNSSGKTDVSIKRDRKRLLIITYYWIPSGGAGVQRWVKFVKYLRDFGWEPIVYTPMNPEYPSEDYTFEKDIPSDVRIIKTPIWEPYNIYRNLFGKKDEKINAGFISENKKSGWKERLSIWIRGNFLIPDPRRFWIKPSVKYLHSYLKENPVDVVVTTGPPHSMHMIGMKLKKQLPHLKWVADFRDPWTKIFFYKDLHLTKIADKYHHYLEQKVLKNANRIIVVSDNMQTQLSSEISQKSFVIPNGFDEDDMLNATAAKLDAAFTISHIGTLTKNQNPSLLWKCLKQICDENDSFKKDLCIQLIGKVDFMVLNDIERNELMESMSFTDYLPHPKAIEKQWQSQVLLLLLTNGDVETAKGILTGKLFEYLAAKRPILAIGPTNGDVANVLGEVNVGKMVNFEDETTLKEVILEYYKQYKEGGLNVVASSAIKKYSRKELTKQLVGVLDEIDKVI